MSDHDTTSPTGSWHPEQDIPAIHELIEYAGEFADLKPVPHIVLKRLARLYAIHWRTPLDKIYK